jgi:DNA-binding NtrC family response regulator
MQVIAIVHEDVSAAAEWAVALSAAGFRVVTSASFDDGKALLDGEVPPALLIASVRLGAYNGLHLIIRGRLDHPEMAAILTSDTPDPSLDAEAARYGAAYMSGRVDCDALLSRAMQALADTAV